MCNNVYYTVQKSVETTTVIKKSKFISNVSPVVSSEQAEEFIENLRKKYWNATHNVYAYTVGLKDDVQKFSDDGEPSGTAGKPVLEVLKAMEIKNVLVVVTRYFGGILLGAGGLVRAYSDSAAQGLKEAGVIKRIKCDEYEVTSDYSFLGKLQWEIKQSSLILKDTIFTENVKLRVCVPVDCNLDFNGFISNITSGAGAVKRIDSYYIDDPGR